nr:cytochrome c biogenesis CcdA family protein [Caldicoprobacter guelmensis]
MAFVSMVFVEGVASFLSPCVLPLIPVYLAYLTGQSIENLFKEPSKAYYKGVLNAFLFVAGFSIVFISMGAVASSFGRFLVEYRDVIRRISGVLIVLFGLFHVGLIPIPFLNYEKRFNIGIGGPGFVTSILMGMGFGFGWTPCVGPMLASALVMASQAHTIGEGIGLLAIYSLGLGLPFMVLALGIRVLWKPVKKVYKYMDVIRWISGGLLIIIGLLIFFNRLAFF